MNFSEKLFEIRKQKGMSQEELADRLNVSRQTISKWETGLTTPEMEKLIEMSKLFEITIDELVGNDNNVKDEKEKSNDESITEKLDEEVESKIADTKKPKKHHVVFKVIKVILIIYLVLSIYKFIAVSIISSIGNSFSEENYMITHNLKANYGADDGSLETYFEFIKKGNIFIERAYNYAESDEPYYIVYTDIDKKTSFRLNYDKEMQKYVVSDENKHLSTIELNEKYESIVNYDLFKSLSGTIPEELGYRLMISFNPFSLVSLIGKKVVFIAPFDLTTVSEYNKDGLLYRVINKKWGSGEFFEVTNSYDYVQDHIENMNIENPLEKYKDKIVYFEDIAN